MAEQGAYEWYLADPERLAKLLERWRGSHSQRGSTVLGGTEAALIDDCSQACAS